MSETAAFFVYRVRLEDAIALVCIHDNDGSPIEFDDSFQAMDFVAKRVNLIPDTQFFVLWTLKVDGKAIAPPARSLPAKFCEEQAIYAAFRRNEEIV
jgi:hypothetical protein